MVPAPPPTTLQDLPEELVIEILGHCLYTPLDAFFKHEFDKHMSYALHRREMGICPDYELLVVCKQWWTLAEPILYSRLVLVSIQDVRRVASFLKRKPSIGPRIRYLRLHGGFGRELVELAERATCVEAIYLSSQEVYSSADAVDSLERALHTFAPSILYIGFMNKSFSSMADSYDAMMYFLQYSDSLKHVYFARFVHFTESLEDALVSSPSIETVSFYGNLLHMIAFSGNLLERLVEKGRIRVVICRDSEHWKDRFERKYPKDILRLISFD